MNSVKLGNKKVLQIKSKTLIDDIINRVEHKWKTDITYKRYHFLDKNRAKELKQSEHKFVLNTFGAKYLIYLTTQNSKKYVLYISRKTKEIFLVKTRFDESLFNDTIIEGELLNIKNRWYFYLSDIHVYKNEKVIMKPFCERYQIMNNFVKNEYQIDYNIEPFSIIIKRAFDYNEILKCKEMYIDKLPFRINGFLFKNNNPATYDILYIFPEHRNKQSKQSIQSSQSQSTKPATTSVSASSPTSSPTSAQTLASASGLANINGSSSPKSIGNVNVNVNVSSPDTISSPEILLESGSGSMSENEKILKIKITDFPDVYILYEILENETGNVKKEKNVGYASIPNLECSNKVREWFLDGSKEHIVKCVKNEKQNKFIPIEIIQ